MISAQLISRVGTVCLSLIWIGMFFVGVTRFGGREYYKLDVWIPLVCVWAIIALLSLFYVLYVSRMGNESLRPRFTIRWALVFTAATAALCALGYAMDALVMLAFLFYALTAGTVASRYILLLGRKYGWTNETVMIYTSSIIVVTFAVLATAITVGVLFIIPPGMKFDAESELISLLVFPSVIAGYIIFLGDDFQNTLQLVLYGLPIGLPLLLLFSALSGMLLGKVAVRLRTSRWSSDSASFFL